MFKSVLIFCQLCLIFTSAWSNTEKDPSRQQSGTQCHEESSALSKELNYYRTQTKESLKLEAIIFEKALSDYRDFLKEIYLRVPGFKVVKEKCKDASGKVLVEKSHDKIVILIVKALSARAQKHSDKLKIEKIYSFDCHIKSTPHMEKGIDGIPNGKMAYGVTIDGCEFSKGSPAAEMDDPGFISEEELGLSPIPRFSKN